MLVRPSVIKRAECFDADVKALRDKYPELDVAVDGFVEALKSSGRLPDIAIDRADFPQVYYRYIDYPPRGSLGRKAFVITYHVRWSGAPVGEPCRTTTLLTLVEVPARE